MNGPGCQERCGEEGGRHGDRNKGKKGGRQETSMIQVPTFCFFPPPFILMYWIRRRTGREDPTHTSHNQANFLAGFKCSDLMLTVLREYLFQVPAVLTFNPAINLGSSIVDLIQIPPPSNIQAYRCSPAMGSNLTLLPELALRPSL